MAAVTEKFVDFFDMVGQTEWTQSVHRSIIHWIGLTEEHAVLDAGCGSGHLILRLAQRAKWVTGLDSSATMIERASANAFEHDVTNVSFVRANIRAMPLESHTFDTVLCSDLLFLFERPELALEPLIRVCKPDGQVIIVNPAATMNPWSAKTYCEKHRLRDFERDSLLGWATAAAKRTLMTSAQLESMANACGGRLTDTVPLLEGMVSMYRIVHEDSF